MILLRKATESDFDLLRNMYLKEVEQHHERAEVFAHELLTLMNTILCLCDDILCGTVSWAIRGGMDDGVIEIIGLGVREDSKRKGIATRLMNQALEDAREKFASKRCDIRRAFLFMEESNQIARVFYQKLGFEEAASIPEFYPCDGASIFVKKL